MTATYVTDKVRAEGFRPAHFRLRRVKYLGQWQRGGTTYNRILYRHEASGVEVVRYEDDLNRARRDYCEDLSEEQAEAIGLVRAEVECKE